MLFLSLMWKKYLLLNKGAFILINSNLIKYYYNLRCFNRLYFIDWSNGCKKSALQLQEEMFKTVNMFVETFISFIVIHFSKCDTVHLFQGSLMNRKLNRKNINIFTVTLDQFNVSLLNKSINFFKNKSYWPQTFER